MQIKKNSISVLRCNWCLKTQRYKEKPTWCGRVHIWPPLFPFPCTHTLTCDFAVLPTCLTFAFFLWYFFVQQKKT